MRMLTQCLMAMLLAMLATAGAAQERFTFVIDGSNSMWGQVDGQPKVAILRNAIDDVLGRLNTEADVGVVAFGHREKGNCNDIEEILPPGPFDAAQVAAAIRGINPIGKTPLSDAVRFAAESIRYTEDRATVIILGDGRESCEKDPCAVAEELERIGVDLTVHAIAFDLADDEGRAQLQCFARETGGLFLPASNTAELIAALEEVRVEVAAEPLTLSARFFLIDQATGREVSGQDIDWSLRNTAEVNAVTLRTDGTLERELMPGTYQIAASVPALVAAAGTVSFSIAEGSPTDIAVPILLPVAGPATVTLTLIDAATGQQADTGSSGVVWSIRPEGGAAQEHSSPTADTTVTLDKGVYELSAKVPSYGTTSAMSRLEVQDGKPIRIALNIAGPAPQTVALSLTDAATGTLVNPGLAGIRWEITSPDGRGNQNLVSNGDSAEAQLLPGAYKVKAVLPGLGVETELAEIEVVPGEPLQLALPIAMPRQASMRLIATDLATGLPIEGALSWTFIKTGTEEIHDITAASGSEMDALPAGDYEVIVLIGDSVGEAVATVAESGMSEIVVAVAMAAPPGLTVAGDIFPAGSAVPVTWNFKGQPDDIIFVAPLDMRDNSYPSNNSRSRQKVGNATSATLVAPGEPGTFEARYYSLSAGGLVHRAPFNVGPAEVVLDGPDQALAGKSIMVTWSGPGLTGDFIFVSPLDWKKNAYPSSSSAQTKVEGGSRLWVSVPEREGTYEIRYFSKGAGRMLHAEPITVGLPGASVRVPERVAAGAVFKAEFDGPRAKGDRLFVAKLSMNENRYVAGNATAEAVRKGSPAALVAPVNEGRYEVRYYSVDGGGLLARAAFEVGPAEVTLEAPRIVNRATSFRIRIKGPDAPGDMVFVAQADWRSNQYPGSRRDRFDPGPGGGGFFDDEGFYVFETVAPPKPGRYEVRYYSRANADVLARRAIIVK